MKTATKVKDMTGWTGAATLYRLSEHVADVGTDEVFEYVIVSATVVAFSGPETYIFPSNADGAVQSWSELEGSFRGGLSHAEALRGAGYEIA